jgi:hypothetical protein
VTQHNRLDPATRRYIRCRLLQGLFGLGMAGALLLAALARPVFDSPLLGWLLLLLVGAAYYGFHWAGKRADRRGRHTPL